MTLSVWELILRVDMQDPRPAPKIQSKCVLIGETS